MRRRKISQILVGVLFGLVVAVRPALAQSGGGGSLGDIIVWAVQEALRVLFRPVEAVIQRHADSLVAIVVETPHPETVFARPTNGAWPNLYDYYWDAIVPVSLLLYALAIGLVIFLESTSHLFSNYHRTKLKKRAFSGLLGLLAWWWVDALARQLMSELTTFLVPDLSGISLFETLSFGAMGALGVALTLAVDFSLFVLIALIYFMRQVVLYLFTLMMPLLIVFWVPGVGPFALVSGFMKRLAGFYVPFLFMTVPVALLFRLGELLGSSFGLSMAGLGAWLTALVIPVVAVVSPLVLFWQAGALFMVADRTGRHLSAQRARQRYQSTEPVRTNARQGGRNLARGLRGDTPVARDGQTQLGGGDSRAHAAGAQLRTSAAQVRDRVRGVQQTRQNSQTRPGSVSRDVTFEDRRSDQRSLSEWDSGSNANADGDDPTEGRT